MKAEVADIWINYELTGSPDLPVVVMSHPLGGSLEIWDSQIDALSSHFRILRYDTRGHGGTSAPNGPYSMDTLVVDALSLLDDLEVDKVHWVGLSLGGLIGQGLAIASPERLLSMSLCNTVSCVREDARKMWKVRHKPGQRFNLQDVVDYAMKVWLTEGYRNAHRKEYEEIRQRFLSTPVHGYTACIGAIMNADFTDHLTNIQIPTLIVASDQDIATPIEESRIIDKGLPNSDLQVISGAAHLSNVEQSERFNEILFLFLNSVSGKR